MGNTYTKRFHELKFEMGMVLDVYVWVWVRVWVRREDVKGTNMCSTKYKL